MNNWKFAYDTISRVILNEYRKQVPVKSGALRNSLQLKVLETSKDIDFELNELKYGTYLDLGTGKYRSTNRGPWNKNPGKGTDGIKPRFWKTLSTSTNQRIKMILEKEIVRQLNNKLKNI